MRARHRTAGVFGSGRVACALGLLVLAPSAWAQFGVSTPPIGEQLRDELRGAADAEPPPNPQREAARARRIRELGPGLSSIDTFQVTLDPNVNTQNAPDDLADLVNLEVELALVKGVWRSPAEAPNETPVRLPISVTPTRTDVFATSALRVIQGRLEDALLLEREDDPLLGWVTVDLPPPPSASPSLDPNEGAPVGDRVARLLVLLEASPVLVDDLSIRFVPSDHPDLPDVEVLLDQDVELGVTPDGALSRPSERFERTTLNLSTLEPGTTFTTTGLIEVVAAVTDHLRQEEKLVGILVTPSPEQIDVRGRTYEDSRDEGDTSLTIEVYLSVVQEFRTLAFGDRVAEEEREDSPLHKRIVERSTVKQGDLLRRDQLDEYLHRMNRLGGRRVSAALSPAEGEGVQVDYLISERRPILVYGQVSNTGTEQTDRLRFRFGGQLSQLANLDDTLTLDYINAGLSDETQGFLGQYESDIPGTDRFRYRLEVAYSEFVASDVGLAGEEFSGDSTRVAGGIIWNVYQKGELFVDLLAGARWQNVSVENDVVNESGDSDFFVPRVGARLERRSRVAETTAYLTVEFNLPGVADTAEVDELEALGRLEIDRDWQALRWGVNHSFYLEPLIDRRGWEDVTTPRSSTLAHEVKLGFSGQTSLGTRLIPQEEQVVGGLFTVRGYPESVVSGDNVFLINAEYRFHLPRALAYSPSPGELFGQPFRWRPQEVYGEADWDFVLKAFVDAAWVDNQDRLPFETEDNLLGVGLGAEFSLRRNLFVRVDWGVALEALEERETPVDEGDNEWHFVVTVLF